MKASNSRDGIAEFALAPPGKAARVFLGLFTLVIPLMIVLAMIAIPEFRPPLAGFAVTVIAIVAVAAALLVATRRRSIRLHGDRLEVKATFYTRRVALDAIDVDSARILDLREHPDNKPFLKTNGLAVPGLAVGNFRDRKRRKVFCLVTAPRVLVLPLGDDSRLLLSAARPTHLVRELRRRANRGAVD